MIRKNIINNILVYLGYIKNNIVMHQVSQPIIFIEIMKFLKKMEEREKYRSRYLV